MKKLMFSSIKVSLLALVFFLSGCSGMSKDTASILDKPQDVSNQTEEPNLSAKTLLSADALVKQAKKTFNSSGSKETALNLAKKALQLEPNHNQAPSLIGRILFSLGNREEGFSIINNEIKKKPDNHYAHYVLGSAYEELGQNQKAIASYTQVIQIKPDFPNTHLNLGSIFFKTNNAFNAIKHAIIAAKLFERQNAVQGAAVAKSNLRIFLKEFQTYRLEDFANVQIPGPSQASSPASPPSSQKPPQAVKSVYSGTGFLFSAKDYVITNWHVVRGTNNIKVKFLNGEEIEAEVALKDPQNDIAFLKLKQSPQLPPSNLKIADSSKVRMGDKVFTIGYPAHFLMGDNPKYTEGVVNATSGLQDDPTVFQVSVEIQPGNSGGPLFNATGEVIGITSSSLDPKAAVEAFGTLPQNVNYAVKSSYISALLPMLPQTLIASRGIMVVPTEPENTLANFIEKAKKNIVLIEAKE
jgi:S1-C subfamily serine protease